MFKLDTCEVPLRRNRNNVYRNIHVGKAHSAPEKKKGGAEEKKKKEKREIRRWREEEMVDYFFIGVKANSLY